MLETPPQVAQLVAQWTQRIRSLMRTADRENNPIRKAALESMAISAGNFIRELQQAFEVPESSGIPEEPKT